MPWRGSFPRQVTSAATPVLLLAPPGATEARDDLIEDEQAAELPSHPAEAFEEIGIRRDNAHVPGDGLDQDGRNLIPVAAEETLHGSEVVVLRQQRVRTALSGTPAEPANSRWPARNRLSRARRPHVRGMPPRT